MNLHSKSQAEELHNDGQILDKDGPGFKGLPCGDRGEAGRGTPREQAGPGREESVLVCYPINHRFHGEKHVNEEEGEQKCRQKFSPFEEEKNSHISPSPHLKHRNKNSVWTKWMSFVGYGHQDWFHTGEMR